MQCRLWRAAAFVRLRYPCCIYFWGKKINLCGISGAKRSRSGPNSVYVDNIQGILGAIGPFWAKLQARTSPVEPKFFCVVIQTTFQQLRNCRFSPNLATKCSSMFRRIRKDIFGNLHFAPKIWNRKWVKQAPHSEQATGHGMHCIKILLFHVVVQGQRRFQDRSPFSYDVRLRSYGASNLPNFRILAYFPHTKRKKYLPVTSLQPRGYITEWLRCFLW